MHGVRRCARFLHWSHAVRSRLLLLVTLACSGSIMDPAEDPWEEPDPDDVEPPDFAPAPATLHRLTRAEYLQSLADLLPEGTPMPTDVQVDTSLHGFTTIAASELTVSPREAEQYEAGARAVSQYVFADADRRVAFVGCTPSAADDACARDFLATFGRRAWRRPLGADEVDALATLSAAVAARLGGPWVGLEYATSAILQSPHFVFRVEVGELAPEVAPYRRYTDHEMAARLSYFLWGTTPDDALLADADAGRLVTDAGLRAATGRMLDDPRARHGLVRFFGEYVHLARLDTVSKDPDLYPRLTAELRAAMRAEIEHLFATVALDGDADFRRIFDTDATVLDAELAALYGVDPGAETLPEAQRRGGLLGRAGMLTLFAHATFTSPTLRGRFVRIDLLCDDVPPPPEGVDTSLPESEPGVPRTLRERLAEHRSNPVCAGCHDKMDPIGFALERYGALGEWRDTDEGLPIDTATSLDGIPVADAQELGAALAEDDRLAACVARRAYRFATGHLEIETEEITVRELADRFRADGHRFRDLVLSVVMSEGFRLAATELQDVCPLGERRSCETLCGAGTETCDGTGWTECDAPAPAAETCNGGDDDCDGTVDEALSRGCDAVCGGVQRCEGGAWGACTGMAPGVEACSGADEDCDGVVDEGHRTQVLDTTYTTLRAHHPGCDGGGQRRGPECNAAMHRLCAESDCRDAGFGPVENAGDRAIVACVAADVMNAPWASLSAIHGICDGSRQVIGSECSSAIHRWCASRGYVSGFGPVERSASDAAVACLSAGHAETRAIVYADVQAHHAGCHAGTRLGPDCDAAISRYCQAAGFATGFGPIENSGENLSITCVRP